MKKIILLCILLITGYVLNSTAQQVTFQKTFDGASDFVGNHVQQTNDGGFVIVGAASNVGTGNDDLFLVKTDSNGDTLWTRTIDVIGNEVGYSLQQTFDGGFIITGNADSSGFVSNDVY